MQRGFINGYTKTRDVLLDLIGLPGAGAARIVGTTTTAGGAPTTGTFLAGDVVVQNFLNGIVCGLFVCTVGGTPGTWVSVSAIPNGAAGGDLAGSYPGPTIKTSVSLTTPVIGVATGTSLQTTSFLKSSGKTSANGVGYATGAGNTGTQATSRTTTVAFDGMCGTITLFTATLAADTTVSFTFTNACIAATDACIFNVVGGAAVRAAYNVDWVPGAGTAQINVHNLTPTISASEAPQIRFAIIKGVAT